MFFEKKNFSLFQNDKKDSFKTVLYKKRQKLKEQIIKENFYHQNYLIKIKIDFLIRDERFQISTKNNQNR